MFKHAFQPTLVFTTDRETFASKKVCLRENGGRWLTGHRTEKRGQITVGAWKSENFSFPFFSLLEQKKAFKSRDCEMLFFISLFWRTREPEKPWLQQFSNHPISKLRSFQMLWAIQTSWDPLQCAVWGLPCLRDGWNWGKIFFTVRFPFFTSRSLPGTMQSGYLGLLDVWSVLMWIPPHPTAPSYSLSLSITSFRDITLAVHWYSTLFLACICIVPQLCMLCPFGL